MTDDDLTRLRDEVAGVLAGHVSHVMTWGNEWSAECLGCRWAASNRGDYSSANRAHRAHVAYMVEQLLARKIAEARGEALREAADAYDPETEMQARGWVVGWLLDRADAMTGPETTQNGPSAPISGPTSPRRVSAGHRDATDAGEGQQR